MTELAMVLERPNSKYIVSNRISNICGSSTLDTFTRITYLRKFGGNQFSRIDIIGGGQRRNLRQEGVQG